MRILFCTDAWHPQVNGVVRSLSTTVDHLRALGHSVEVIEPSMFWTVPCPTYPEIRLAVTCGKAVRRILDASNADAIHIATEGPIGWAARNWCVKNRRSFTTSFHTRFPDYVSVRTGVPLNCGWRVMRHFHGAAERTFVVTKSLASELEDRGIAPTHLWPLGVDLGQFRPDAAVNLAMAQLPRPVLLTVGRVAVEKNLEAFLGCDVAGSKVIVGDGPALAGLRARYPDVLFLGAKHGAELASAYAAADVFVFPSRTDTFGLVNIEALACGLPVAAFPVRGPLDIIGLDGCGIHGGTIRIGALDPDLAAAIRLALTADRRAAVTEATHYGWDYCVGQFLAGLACPDDEGGIRQAA